VSDGRNGGLQLLESNVEEGGTPATEPRTFALALALMISVQCSVTQLPASAVAAAELLPPALEAAASKAGVQVRATLFDTEFNAIYEYHMEGVPGLMAKIARSKAYSYYSGKELGDPSLAATVFLYAMPWFVPGTRIRDSCWTKNVSLPLRWLVCLRR
jgi:hypothetical protein